MKVELFINDKFFKRWIREDIREDYTELGQLIFEERKNKVINELKETVYKHLEFNEYEFYFIMQSNLNLLHYSEIQMAMIDKELGAKHDHKISKKYKHAS